MGGKPLTALNLVMFPATKLDMGFLKQILRGGSDKVREAGACIAGGHSVDDNEPKYGLAVTGSIHPDRILTNCGCQVGDALILTKPLGTGVLFNANRSGKLAYPQLEAILPQIAALNRRAMEAALRFEVHACTDVTGFGILGHTLELAQGTRRTAHGSRQNKNRLLTFEIMVPIIGPLFRYQFRSQGDGICYRQSLALRNHKPGF